MFRRSRPSNAVPSSERTIRSAARAAAAAAGGDAVVNMYERALFSRSSTNRVRAGDETADRTESLRESPDPKHVDGVEVAARIRTEHGVGLVDH